MSTPRETLTAAADLLNDLLGQGVPLAARLHELADEFDALHAESFAARSSANRWAHKATLLVLWIKANCTPAQQLSARAASVIKGTDER